MDRDAGALRQRTNPWWYATSLILLWAYYQVFDALFWTWPTNVPLDRGDAPFAHAARVNRTIVIGLCIISFLIAPLWRLDRSSSRLRVGCIYLALAVFLGMHVQNWRVNQRSAWLWAEDVSTTSVQAGRLLLRGVDPYEAPLDENHDSQVAAMTGYKYSPFMIAAYAPGGALIRDKGKAALLTNFIFSLAAAMLLMLLVWKWISIDAGLICALLFFMSQLISLELVQRGTNDIVPMVLAFAALLCIEKRFLCGLLVGLAVSSKIVPGLFWVPFCLTPRSPRKYLLGIGAAIVPIYLPFLLWDAHAFAVNVLWFPFIHPVAGESPFVGAPHWMILTAQGIVLFLFLAFAYHARKKEIPGIHRCVWAAALTLCFQLASPNAHENYYIWWYMPFCVAITALIFHPTTYEWIGRSSRAA